MLRSDDARTFLAGLDAKMLDMEKEVNEVFRGFCVSILFDILKENPQWSGNAVANWNFSVGKPNTTVDLVMKEAMDTSKSIYGKPKYVKGDRPGIDRAISRNRGNDRGITVKSEVFLTNAATDLLGREYAVLLESNANNFLREANTPGHMVQQAVDKVEFGDITFDTPRLRGLRI